MTGAVTKTLTAALDILNGASVLLILSFALAGLIHALVSPDRLQRTLGNSRLSTLAKATVSGMLLPICSCGVIPIGLSLYYSGAYLGPTLAFMAATPIINPAAVILAYSLLGWRIATIYLIAGFVVPMIIGFVGNRLGGSSLRAPGLEEGAPAAVPAISHMAPLKDRLAAGQRWGFAELGLMVSRYVVVGMLLAGAIIALVPQSLIQAYLGDPGALSLGAGAILGAIMYVCAVGHIPFTAALVASGAAPGLALTFLMTGAATNAPELLSIWKLMGRRPAIIYSGLLVLASFAVGAIANALLGPGFVPTFDTSGSEAAVGFATALSGWSPVALEWACSAAVIAMGAYAWWTWATTLVRGRATVVA
jgi:hypothetical protein